jgi:hypothetical protein
LTVTAAVKKLSVVGSGTATGSVSVKSFEWKSVWVSAAAGFLAGNTFDSRFDWATFVVAGIETVVVSVGVVIDLGSRQEESEKTVNELTFDGASVSGTVVVVQGVARVSEVDAGTGSWVVGDFPWDARFTGGFGIDDGTLVSVSESFAESVDFIDRGTFTSANVVVEVAPASVLVQRVDGVGDVTGESSERAVSDKRKDLSVDAVFVSGGKSHEGGCNEFSDHYV